MAKTRFVIFFDGTWQTTENQTNIALMYDALDAEEMSYKLDDKKHFGHFNFKRKHRNTLAPEDPQVKTIKVYFPGVGNEDDHKKLGQYLFAATGEGSLDIANHAVACIQKAVENLGLNPEDVEISIGGFSRGATSATYFAQKMYALKYKLDRIFLLDRVRSEHLIGRIRTAKYDMSLPPANAILHLVSGHDRRTWPDEKTLPYEYNFFSLFDPELIRQNPASTAIVKEIYMAGCHGDIGGSNENEPQARDARRLVTYMLLIGGYIFSTEFLKDLVLKEDDCPPVTQNEDFTAKVVGGIANKIIYHDRTAIVRNQEGKKIDDALPIIHERVLSRLIDETEFKNTNKPYDIAFLKDKNRVKVMNDDGEILTKYRKKLTDTEWIQINDSKRTADPLFDFAKAREIAFNLLPEVDKPTTREINGFAPRKNAFAAGPVDMEKAEVRSWNMRFGKGFFALFGKCMPMAMPPEPSNIITRPKVERRPVVDF